jgi:hypothetical protein
LDETNEPALILVLDVAPLELSPSGGLDIVGSSNKIPAAALLANIVFGSADAAENDVLSGLDVSGVVDLLEVPAEGEAGEGREVNGEKTDPSTRFAFSRDASFLSSMRNLEALWGWGGGGGLRSKGTKPAGKRVICIECGRRCRGLQGGSGSLAGRDFSR